MQFYCGRFYNFLRFRETDNTVVFDLSSEQNEKIEKGEETIDSIYDKIMVNPKEHVEAVKSGNLNSLIAICGTLGGNSNRSNGAGKSTILESIAYALYGRIVRQEINTVKNDSIYDFVSKIDNKYPEGLKESWVEWLFEEKGRLYVVKRGVSISGKSKSPILEFYEVTNGTKEGLSSHRTKETAEQIENVIGYDYDVFSSSIMFGQDDSGKFLIGKDKDRKEMIIKILHLEDVVAGCLEKVREFKNDKEKEIKKLNIELDVVQKRVEGKNDKDIEAQIEILKRNIKEHNVKIEENNDNIEKLASSKEIKDAEELKNEGLKCKESIVAKEEEIKSQTKEWTQLIEKNHKIFKDKTNDCENSADNIRKLESRQGNIEKEISSFKMEEVQRELSIVEKAKKLKPEIEKKLESLNGQYAEKDKTLSVLKSDMLKKDKEIASLEKQIAEAGDTDNFICDKCKSVVSRQHVELELKKTKDSASLLRSEIEAIEKEMLVVKQEVSEFKVKNDKAAQWLIKEGSLLGSIKDNEKNKTISKDIKEQIEKEKKVSVKISEEKVQVQNETKEYEEKIKLIDEKYKKEIEGLNKHLDEIRINYKKMLEGANRIKEQIEKLKKENQELFSKKSNCDTEIGNHQREIKTIKEELKRIVEVGKEIELKTKEWKRYILLDEVFGLEGIQTRIANKYLPVLNRYVEEILSVLSNGEMKAEIITNEKSNIDIKIQGNTGNSYNMISGGEKGLLRLSLSIGLALLSFVRTAQKPEMIGLDEIFGNLDPERKMAVFGLLANLQEKFNRILLISHDPEINNKIPFKILVEKSQGHKGTSSIRKIGIVNMDFEA